MAPRRRSFDEVRVTQNVILQRSSDSVSPMMSAQDQRASWFETRRGRYVFRASGRLLARRDACSRVGTPARASGRLLARRDACSRVGTPARASARLLSCARCWHAAVLARTLISIIGLDCAEHPRPYSETKRHLCLPITCHLSLHLLNVGPMVRSKHIADSLMNTPRIHGSHLGRVQRGYR
jgi:hypothetical protein